MKIFTEPECTNGSVQLVDGSSPNEGRVELCQNDQWGRVCGNNWDRDDARVVCRQLELPTQCKLMLSAISAFHQKILLQIHMHWSHLEKALGQFY